MGYLPSYSVPLLLHKPIHIIPYTTEDQGGGGVSEREEPGQPGYGGDAEGE